MPASNKQMIKKLQAAINNKGFPILYNTIQFYSRTEDRPITMYQIKTVRFNEETGKNKHIEIFKSTSQIQIVLLLRDIWFLINNQELPTDNEMWNKQRENIEILTKGMEVIYDG